MTAENFESTLRGLHQIRPYRVFTVELVGGQRFEVDHPDALSTRDGIAVFLAPGGIPIIFDHDSVLSFIAAPAGTSRNGE